MKGEEADSVELLRRVPLFAGFEEGELELLAASARRVRYPRGSVVFQEGDAGGYLLVVAKGRVKVTLLGEDGGSACSSRRRCSEIALLGESPRSATVITLAATEFLQIARGPFLALIRRHPQLALRIMAQLARALRKATEQVRSLAMFDVHGRMLRALLILARQNAESNRSRIVIRPRPAIKDLALMWAARARQPAGR